LTIIKTHGEGKEKETLSPKEPPLCKAQLLQYLINRVLREKEKPRAWGQQGHPIERIKGSVRRRAKKKKFSTRRRRVAVNMRITKLGATPQQKGRKGRTKKETKTTSKRGQKGQQSPNLEPKKKEGQADDQHHTSKPWGKERKGGNRRPPDDHFRRTSARARKRKTFGKKVRERGRGTATRGN